MVTVGISFSSSSSGSPTVSERFPHCLLPSFVIVMSYCHICLCDASFVYPSPTPALYGSFHWYQACSHVFFSGSSFSRRYRGEIELEIDLHKCVYKKRGLFHFSLLQISRSTPKASLTLLNGGRSFFNLGPLLPFPGLFLWLKQGFIVLLRGRL